MSIDFSFFITLFLTTPSAVVLLVWIDVGGCLCPIYSSAWSDGIAYLNLMYRATILASAAEDMIFLIICAIVSMAPLFGGSGHWK